MSRYLIILLALVAARAAAAGPRVVVLNDDGGWCWFEDERAIVAGGRLIAATVAAGVGDPNRRGAVEVASYDLKTGARTLATLHRPGSGPGERRWLDDHNSPGLLELPDGRILALYSLHGDDEKIYYRVSARPGDAAEWGAEKVYAPCARSRVTYANPHWLGAEKRIYNFFRGLDASFKPSYIWSEDLGETWRTGNVIIDVPGQFRHRPYVKYASDRRDTVHIAYTDGHPRNFDNSIYHVYYRQGKLFRSDGSPIRGLDEGLKRPEEGTRVFQGDPNNVGWISDLHIDRAGRPWLAYSVQKDSAGLPPETSGEDHRYRYARWDGSRWRDFEIAHAGSKLYTREDDYTGNIALDPRDPKTVFISTNVDPVSGKPLKSGADGARHWEIYRGETGDGGATWRWQSVTRDSKADNIRPVVPPGERGGVTVLWLRGKMRSYTDYTFEVVAQLR